MWQSFRPGCCGDDIGVDFSSSCTLKILSINDVYEIGLFPQVATCKIEERKKGGDLVISVLPGDFVAPSLLSSLDKGASMIDCMNRADIDYVCIGNHENDVKLSALYDRIRESRFTWINSNMQSLPLPPDIASLPEYVILEVKGGGQIRRIALLGLNTDDPSVYRPGAFGGCTIDPIMEKARSLNAWILAKEKVDLVIPLTHQFIDEDRKLARSGLFPLIIGGHDHDAYLETIEGCTIVKSGMNATLVSVTSIRWPDVDSVSPIISVEVKETASYEPKPDVQQAVLGHFEILKELEGSMLCQIPDGLVLSSEGMRIKQTTIGTFICNAVRDSLGAECTLLNAGAIRSNRSYEGEKAFTYAHMNAELPFKTRMVVVQLPGKVICDMVRFTRAQSVQMPPVEFGGYLQTDDGIVWDRLTNTVSMIKRRPVVPDELYVTVIPWIVLDGVDRLVPLLDYKASLAGAALAKVSDESGMLIQEIVLAHFSKMLLFQMVQSSSFEDLDTDHDGSISRDELMRMAEKKFGSNHMLSSRVISNLFAIADEDGSGSISANELVNLYISAMSSVLKYEAESSGGGRGSIDLSVVSERVQNFAGHSEEVRNAVSSIDTNADKQISSVELHAFESKIVRKFIDHQE